MFARDAFESQTDSCRGDRGGRKRDATPERHLTRFWKPTAVPGFGECALLCVIAPGMGVWQTLDRRGDLFDLSVEVHLVFAVFCEASDGARGLAARRLFIIID